jgi:hypothetical protein
MPTEHYDQVFLRVVDVREKVHISCCSSVRICPDTKQQRAFEDEGITISGLAQTIQEALHREVLQEFIEGTT